MVGRRYAPEEREAALELLIDNHGNIHETARQTGISRASLIRWSYERDAVLAGMEAALLHPKRARSMVDRAADLFDKTIDRANEQLDDKEHPPRLHDIAAIMRESHTSHLNLRDGRKGFEVNVDNRSITRIYADKSDAELAEEIKALEAELEAGNGR